MDGRALRGALRNGQTVIGTMISEVWSPTIAQMVATAGFDFLVIDMEHGSFNMESVAGIVLASHGAGIAAIVRVSWHDRAAILRPLEAGAAGVLAPQIERPEQVEQLVRFAKYRPLGERGVALRRAHSRYRQRDPEEYTAEANEYTTVVIQLETAAALARLPEVVAVPGVDAVFVGPSDLSHSLGHPGRFDHPVLVEALERTIQVCRHAAVAPGIHLTDPDALRAWIGRGMRFVTFSSDVGFLVDGAAAGLARVRSANP